VGKGVSPLQQPEQTVITSQIHKRQPLDPLMSPYLTFIDKHKNLSDEECCKIPAVQMKKDLQWCGGQLRDFVKIIIRTSKDMCSTINKEIVT